MRQTIGEKLLDILDRAKVAKTQEELASAVQECIEAGNGEESWEGWERGENEEN